MNFFFSAPIMRLEPWGIHQAHFATMQLQSLENDERSLTQSSKGARVLAAVDLKAIGRWPVTAEWVDIDAKTGISVSRTVDAAPEKEIARLLRRSLPFLSLNLRVAVFQA